MSADLIKILLVEDSPTDEALIKRQISKLDFQTSITVVKDLEDIKRILESEEIDIVISDYNLPTCTGLDVLELVKEISSQTTFIFVTGTIQDEELAADTILNGASGYILKNNINNLHVKLKPHFEAIARHTKIMHPIREKITRSRRLVSDIELFLENFSKENLAHREGIERIKKEIERIRQQNDSKNPS